MFRKKIEKKTEAERVEERREEVLAAGRKFKYPLQYTKHRIVVNTILIAVVMMALLVVGGWFALFKLQMTSDVLYRVTRVLPVSVATVEGEPVRFADYLMLYRASVISVERQSGTFGDDEASEELSTQYKRVALSQAEEYTYAIKLAKELGIKVTSEEITNEFERHRQVGGVDRSKAGFLKIVNDNFGMSENEYRRMLELNLVEAKVAVAVDEEAQKIAEMVEQALATNGGNYQKTAEQLGDKVLYEETGGMVDSRNIDGGRSSMAMKLAPGEQSGKFVSLSGDGYYFVKLIEKTETEVNFVSLKVPFTVLDEKFAEVSEAGRIKEFIEVGDL